MIVGLLAALLLPLGVFCQDAQGQGIEGFWYYHQKRGTAVSKIYLENGTYRSFCFGFTNAGVEQEKDAANPDRNKRGRSMRGVLFLYDLTPQGEKGRTVWTRGRVYNPRNGQSYKSSAGLSEDGNTLNIRVSIDEGGILGATLNWERVADPAALARFKKLTEAIRPVHPYE